MVRRVALAGSADCLLVDLGGPTGVARVCESRAAIGSVRHHIEGGWVHGERAGHHTDALGQWFRV